MALRAGTPLSESAHSVDLVRGRPRIAVLCCGAGGSSHGYWESGWEPVGFDVRPQPNYPFEFHQIDVLALLRDVLQGSDWLWRHAGPFAAVHASPPCQKWTVLGESHRRAGKDYVDVLTPLRPLLDRLGLPYVIENVPGAPMRPDVVLCGQQFGWEVRRHRWFECNWPISPLVPTCDHSKRPVVTSGNNHSGGFTAAEIKAAMQMPWAKTRYEVRQAIPWVFTEWIGRQLIAVLDRSAEVSA